MITLDDLNMKHIAKTEDVFSFDGKEAVLRCSVNWTFNEVNEWLENAFDFDATAAITDWLHDNAYCSEGMCLKIWID